MSKETRVRELIVRWTSYRATIPESRRYCELKNDLYQVRNPGFNGSPPLSAWPAHLLDSDPEVMAAVEHYFLCRCWVGTGQYPAWEVRALRDIYDFGKRLGITPRHNPNNPTTPPSQLQRRFQEEGITHGQHDLQHWGRSAPTVTAPPRYY